MRYKTASGRFPEYALKNCLEQTGLSIHNIDLIGFDGQTNRSLSGKIKRTITDLHGHCPQLTAVHHADSHCYAAYYTSGFTDCLVISLDGNGDHVSGRIYKVQAGNFTHVKTFPTASSLGNFYTACTNYLGFKSVEGEYKVMGMAAYGTEDSETFKDNLKES